MTFGARLLVFTTGIRGLHVPGTSSEPGDLCLSHKFVRAGSKNFTSEPFVVIHRTFWRIGERAHVRPTRFQATPPSPRVKTAVFPSIS